MTHLLHPDARPRAVAPPRAPLLLRAVAVVLLVLSAWLQLDASLQRWVTARASWTRRDRLIEDHLFDYAYPADPWEPVGDAAQRYGAGMILLAVGLVAVAVALGGTRVTGGVLVVLVAGPFAAQGVHALASGILGRPSPLVHLLGVLALVQLAGGIAVVALVVAARVRRTPTDGSPADAVAVVLALGASVPGYLVATFAIAPLVNGTGSYDTTPWTETVVAASTAAAALAMLVSAVAVRRRGAVRTGGARRRPARR